MEPHTCEVLTRLPEPLGACVYIPEPLLQTRWEAGQHCAQLPLRRPEHSTPLWAREVPTP